MSLLDLEFDKERYKCNKLQLKLVINENPDSNIPAEVLVEKVDVNLQSMRTKTFQKGHPPVGFKVSR